jgi:L-ascorbate metabolism protein UlaG (beta-lactamase superfamily)
VPLDRLPPLDAILISHDHYDHLDMATVRALRRTQLAPFLVPLGVGAHLERWGVPGLRIVELDWGESVSLAGLRFTATSARHFSGRGFSRDRTLWSSWVVAGDTRRLFYTGDSGYFEGYAAIGETHGPFDVTLMQIGAYDPAWPNIHMYPEEAVSAHLDLRGDLLIPVHWATFNLAVHSWADPVNRLWREAKARDVRLAIPRPGERVVANDPPPVDGWWQSIA